MQLNQEAQRSDADTTRKVDRGSFSDECFRDIGELVKREAGLILHESKKLMIGSRIAKRLRATGLQTYDEYRDFLRSDKAQQEYALLIGVLTTNVTAFFREEHHFADFEENILPDLINRGNRGERVRLWSAGCSIGAEPYSLALLINDRWPNVHSADFKILATDIDPVVLAQAKSGRYAASLVEKEIPLKHQDKFQSVDADTKEVIASVRNLVSVRPLNLIQPWPLKTRFDSIFCRNVVIYFDAETTDRIWNQFADLLSDSGRLYIGHSERIKGSAVKRFAPVGVTVYRKIEA